MLFVYKSLGWIALGVAVTFGAAGLFLWDREPLPHGIYKGKAWYCFEEDGIPYLDIEGVIFIRSPQIPVDVNKADDASYTEMLDREGMKCMRNLDYNSPYAIDYHLHGIGFRQTPFDRLEAATRRRIRDFKKREEERRQAELIERDECFLAP